MLSYELKLKDWTLLILLVNGVGWGNPFNPFDWNDFMNAEL